MITSLKFNWTFWNKILGINPRIKAQKRLTKLFYQALDVAIEQAKVDPKKRYIFLDEATQTWKIMNSYDIKQVRKRSKEVRKDATFMHLHEQGYVICKENLQRLIHEQKRRKSLNKFWNRWMGNYYVPITKEELHTLRRVLLDLKLFGSENNLIDQLEEIIKKHS